MLEHAEGSRHEGIREGALFCPGESGGACHWQVRGQEYKKSGCATSSPALRVLAAVAFTSRKKTQNLSLIRDFSNCNDSEPILRNTSYNKASTQTPMQTHSNMPKNEIKFHGTILIFIFSDKV